MAETFTERFLKSKAQEAKTGAQFGTRIGRCFDREVEII